MNEWYDQKVMWWQVVEVEKEEVDESNVDNDDDGDNGKKEKEKILANDKQQKVCLEIN